MTTLYQFALDNTKAYIKSEQNQKDTITGQQLDAFTAARVLAIAMMKDQNEVLVDLLKP